MPILEAMQSGVPVIAGNRTSTPQVVGEAGLLFDPFDTNALVEALQRMLDDANYREALRSRGLQRASEFTWRKTAQLTLKAYEQAAEAHKDSRRVFQ